MKKDKVIISQHVLEHAGMIIRIGKDAKSNTELIKSADSSDIWIHVADHSGAHCIIEYEYTIDPHPDIILHCCMTLKQMSSKLRDLRGVTFHVTRINNLKLGRVAGQVTFKNPADVTRVKC